MKHEATSSEPSTTERLAEIRNLPADEKWEALRQLAHPLSTAPKPDEWVVIAAGEDTDETFRVPFTQSEVEAINGARAAYGSLMHISGQTSGAARGFVTETFFFPSRNIDLQDRAQAVWGVLSAAVSAQDALTQYEGTAWQPIEEEAEFFQAVAALPDSLAVHEPTYS